MFFSVIIPNLNSPIVNRTVESILKQQFDRTLFEIIVIGMDRFNLIKNNDQVIFIDTKKQISPAKARNRGAKIANGKVLVFIDSD